MGIQRSQEDSWTREMRKWEQRPVLVNGTYIEPIPFAEGGRGGAPHQEYPKMLVKADYVNGTAQMVDYVIVKNEGEELLQLGNGWSLTQQDAIENIAKRQLELATLAANRAHNDRWMSDKAKAEAAAYDETKAEHVPAIPETPIKPRGKA
jgi:hypothetical protein